MADFPHTAHSSPIAIIPARAFDDTRLGAAPLKLLGLLGTYANRSGWCWPSITTLAKRMGVNSRQAIQKHLVDLATLGYLKVQRQLGGVNRYRILYDADLPTVFDRMADELPANSTLAPPCQPDVAPQPTRQREVGTPRQREVGIEPTKEPKKQESPPVSPKGESKPRKRATQWPEGFCLTGKLRDYAARKAPGCDVDRMWEQFENHHRAKGSMFIDWDRAWYKWAGSQYTKPMNGGAHQQPQKKRPQIADMLAAAEDLPTSSSPESDRSH